MPGGDPTVSRKQYLTKTVTAIAAGLLAAVVLAPAASAAAVTIGFDKPTYQPGDTVTMTVTEAARGRRTVQVTDSCGAKWVKQSDNGQTMVWKATAGADATCTVNVTIRSSSGQVSRGTGTYTVQTRAPVPTPTNSVGSLWNAIGGIPSGTDLTAAAQRYDVIILNPWETRARAELKAADPTVTILAYKDLASTRSYAPTATGSAAPTGVGYNEADPSWFAVDTAGSRIEWTPYPGHWQMKVWDADYRQRWVSNVTAEAVANGWDGVFADNDMRTLAPYSKALLPGTTTQEQTDQIIRDGLAALIREAGTSLNAKGKLFIPNHSDGRLDLARWDAAAAYGGAMDEQFLHWGSGTSDSSYVTDWGPTGWVTQTSELATDLTLLVTHSSATDSTALRYGYGSALVRAQGPVVWMGNTHGGAYGYQEWFAWQSIPLGAPTAEGTRQSNGTWTRPFQQGFVIVNPQTTAQTTAVSTTYCKPNGGGSVSGSVTVPAHDAVLLVTC
jgi:hypothetical protein